MEAVRDELRRLGYLDSGLDRFVLAGAGGPAPLAASLRAARRASASPAALLFGLAATLAAAGLDRRLLAEPRDLAVLALYLVVACGAGDGGGVALWAAWPRPGWARRRGRRPGPDLPRNVGLAVALARPRSISRSGGGRTSLGAPLAAQAAGPRCSGWA